MVPYKPSEIEEKWRKRWEEDGLYEAREDDPRPKWYALTMFPYTSGDLHIGHWYALVPSDVHARYMRMKGYKVLHPMGFDAFGLPAENAAIKHGIHPKEWTFRNIERMRNQLKTIGAIYDWRREVITCKPEYYKWTQWFFLKLFEHGLAYRAKAPANWCPSCQTVLANEQVINGRCERCGTEVIRKDLEQWFFRITKYAEELLNFDEIDWPEKIKTMQRNWIGRSEGAEISFGIDGEEGEIRVFTTRPDTVYGVTFMVLAPEHPLVEKLTSPERREEVERYIEKARKKSELERLYLEREKDGVFIGAYAINRLTGERVPIWIGDYVLPTYGTGAVMGVPAHDQRDFEFAKKYGIPIKVVIAPPGWEGEEFEEAYEGEGTLVGSGPFTGLPSEEARRKITEYLEEKGWGRKAVSYRLRDWLISRQRYWGAPIPIVYCDRCGIVPVPEEDLPVLLPDDVDFRPTGESPLARCESFVKTTCPRCKGPARRETDTMDTFMCSSWYFLRYTSPDYDKGPFDPAKLEHWMPVDLYTGGAEHATLHLLYSRFFIKALRDMGLVKFNEPFKKLFTQGTIVYSGQKMSKSYGNIVSADEYVKEYGTDAVRAYLMFLGPWEYGGEWDDRGIVGIYRWLTRVWNLVLDEKEGNEPPTEEEELELEKNLHKTIKRVTEHIEKFKFNTMISSLMELTNHMGRLKERRKVRGNPKWEKAVETLLLLLAPSCPHIAEELWERIGKEYSIHNQRFPTWNEELIKEDTFTLIIQIDGKLRDKVEVPISITEEEAREIALSREKVRSRINGKKIKNIVYVPGRIINIVTE